MTTLRYNVDNGVETIAKIRRSSNVAGDDKKRLKLFFTRKTILFLYCIHVCLSAAIISFVFLKSFYVQHYSSTFQDKFVDNKTIAKESDFETIIGKQIKQFVKRYFTNLTRSRLISQIESDSYLLKLKFGEDKASLLHIAAIVDDVPLGEKLINAGLHVDTRMSTSKQTPLVVAIQFHNTPFVKMLVRNNASITDIDDIGRSAEAVRKSQCAMIRDSFCDELIW